MISIEILIAGAAIILLCAFIYSSWRTSRTASARLDAVLKDRDTYRGLAEASMTYLDALRVRLRVEHSEPDFEYVPRIPPIRHSDPTRIAEDRADVLSLEARLRAITDDIDRLTDGGPV
jgi:hypothetical protein